MEKIQEYQRNGVLTFNYIFSMSQVYEILKAIAKSRTGRNTKCGTYEAARTINQPRTPYYKRGGSLQNSEAGMIKVITEAFKFFIKNGDFQAANNIRNTFVKKDGSNII